MGGGQCTRAGPAIVGVTYAGGKYGRIRNNSCMNGRGPVNPKRSGAVARAMSLTREDLENGRMRRLLAESGHAPRMLTDEELEASIRCVLADMRTGEDLWIFAYG